VRRNPARPPLHFVHPQLPHVPWEYLPSGQRYPGQEIPGLAEQHILSVNLWGDNPVFARQGLQRYLLQLRFADRQLGQLLDRLHATGLYERALIVVTADHGVSFEPGQPRRYARSENIAGIAGVPLFIKAPRQRRSRVEDAHVQTTDLVPTIADYLGARVPWETDGRSLRDPSRIEPRPVKVTAWPQGDTTLPFGDYKARLERVVDRTIALFGSRDRGSGLFASGTDGDLVGLTPDWLPVIPGAEVVVELETPEQFASVKPNGPLIPAFVSGRLTGRASERERLAIAVNGRIQAVTQSYRDPFEDDEEVRFSAMIPVGALRAGSNRVEVYRVEGGGNLRRLVSLSSSPARIKTRNGREVIVLPSGKEVEVIPGAISGFIDDLASEDEALVVRGWAADLERRRIPDQVLVFARNRFAGAGAPTVSRPDVATARGRSFELSGYRLSIPSGRARELTDVSRIRVFALSANRASELRPSKAVTSKE
jgi:Sulfatase